MYHLNTVQGIIDRWAPPSENNTGAYVSDVANRLGVAPTDLINVDARMADLIAAIIHHENGINPYSPQLIAEGIRLMGVA